MTELTADEIRRIRQRSLLLADSSIDSVLGVAQWFGAMQAQDLASAKWSFGARIAGLSEGDVDAAIRAGLILRTWPMRGTIHFVPATDTRWMLELTGVRTLTGAPRRRELLGLTEKDVNRAADVMAGELDGGKALRRPEALRLLAEGGVNVDGQRGYHVLWYLAQIGLTCIGPQDGKQQTFVLLTDWAPKQRKLDHDEALAELSLRYFRGHGPAPQQDLMGWAGITSAAAKAGIAACGDRLVTAPHGGRDFWMVAGAREAAASAADDRAPAIHALPGFDEFILGFKDRSLIFEPANAQQVIPGGNGMFRSAIVDSGSAIGTWTRTIKKGRVEVDPLPFKKLTRLQAAGFGRSIRLYGDFLGLESHMLK